MVNTRMVRRPREVVGFSSATSLGCRHVRSLGGAGGLKNISPDESSSRCEDIVGRLVSDPFQVASRCSDTLRPCMVVNSSMMVTLGWS
jgi:hypothetical protein